MAWYPGASKILKLSGEKKVRAGANTPVIRIVVHVVGMNPVEAPNQAQGGCFGTWMVEKKDQMVSAHFCVERNGDVVQFADTDDLTFGTGWCTGGSIHIEHAGNHPAALRRPSQFDASTRLMGWLAVTHPGIKLDLEGTSETDPGDPTKACITCHRWIQTAAKREIALHHIQPMTISDKACPGKGIIDELPEIAQQARIWKAQFVLEAQRGASLPPPTGGSSTTSP
jgi:hypothetical protein